MARNINLLLCLFICLMTLNIVFGDDWWNSSWTYRQPINISNTAGDLTNYQVRIDLNSSNVGSNFNWSNNGDDIRFTNSTNDLLNFWIESWDSTGQEATIWVNVTYLANNTNTTIYMYYGNPSATSESDGDATFEFFDDFEGTSLDSNKWTGSGTIEVTNSEVSLNQDDYINSILNWSYGYAVISKAKADEQDVEFVGFLNSWIINSNNILEIVNSDVDYPDDFDRFRCDAHKEGTFENHYVDGQLDFRNVYHLYEIRRLSDKALYYQDGNLLYTQENSNYLPTINLKVGIGVWDSSQASTLTLDWVFVRKYNYPDPTINFRSEQTSINLQIISTTPENKTILYPNFTFKVNVTWDNADQTNCSLYLDGIKDTTKTNCTKGINSIKPTNYNHTIYNWFIKCKSAYGSSYDEKQSPSKIVALAEAKGEGVKYYNPFNQTTKSRRLILYPIRSFIYS